MNNFTFYLKGLIKPVVLNVEYFASECHSINEKSSMVCTNLYQRQDAITKAQLRVQCKLKTLA
jgi:hypothetical protein